MSEVGEAPASPEPMRFRLASRRCWWTVGLAVAAVLTAAWAVHELVIHGPLLLVLVWGAMSVSYAVRLVPMLTLTTVDETGIHTLWRTRPWGDVRGVRVSHWANLLVLELDGNKERRLALPASDGERVAALAGVPLITPPRL